MMEFFKSFWVYLVYTAPYLLLGLGAAGLMHSFINIKFIKRHLGGKGLWPVIKASVLGIPLPLCSCAVIPAAVGIRENGASNGATSSFLISTPESGVDSIAATYAMMDLPMTIIRPFAAFLTSSIAGVFQNIFNDFELEESPENQKKKTSCCVANKNKEGVEKGRLLQAFKYGFFKLSDDIAVWLTIGLILGGVLDFFIPADFFQGLNGMMGRLLILGIGIPVYICASASTPIAASLVVKGMAPGAALILLLVGPATNISNIAVLQKYIGKKGVLINIIVIAIVSLVISYVVDYLYMNFSWPLSFKINTHEHEHTSLLAHLMAVVLVGLLIKGIYKEKVNPLFNKDSKACH